MIDIELLIKFLFLVGIMIGIFLLGVRIGKEIKEKELKE
jgi:uncharacterized protein YneF (UPF0154 family)